MKIYRTTDPVIVESVLTHPTVYPFVKDDGSPKAKDFRAVMHPNIHYLVAHKSVEDGADEVTCGIISLFPVTTGVYEVHIGMMPHGRGIAAAMFAGMAMDYVFSGETPLALKLIANIPVFNKRTIRFAGMMGLKAEGVCRKSFMSGQKMHDKMIMGITIDEYHAIMSKKYEALCRV